MAEALTSWAAVEIAAEGVITLNGGIPSVSQIHALLTVMRDCGPLPADIEIGRGYWGTSLRICWGCREIEVFEDRFEFYRFFDGRTDIRHFSYSEDHMISGELIAELRVSD